MAERQYANDPLMHQSDALGHYLDYLLHDDPASPTPADSAQTGAEGPASAPPEKPAATPPAVPPANSPTAAASAPSWARRAFQALLFEAGGLQLAVPMATFRSVVPWTDDIGATPDRPHWCYGTLRHRGRDVLVIDTAALVMARQRAAVKDNAGNAEAHILIVGDGGWGLACRRVGDVVDLTPDEVRWRGRGGKRPWLAGTVLERQCALMDTEAFADMLNQGRPRLPAQ